MAGAWWRHETGLIQVGRRSQRSAEKAGPAMYEGDEDRLDAAEQLAEYDPHAAAEAFSAIACDQAVGDEVRLSATEQLADIDPRAAGPPASSPATNRWVTRCACPPPS